MAQNNLGSYEAQIEFLQNQKCLYVPDYAGAFTELQNIGYFSLISGYKYPFFNSMTRCYHQGTTFEDILSLYYFDLTLQELFLHYTCQIERKLKNVVSHSFCVEYGISQNEYMNRNNYRVRTKYDQKRIDMILSTLKYHVYHDTKHKYIAYSRRKYGNVPLWEVTHAMSMGQIATMYALQKDSVKCQMAKSFGRINDRHVELFLKVLCQVRNICAHNERLIGTIFSETVPDTALHQKMKIPKPVGKNYLYGKRDLFGVIIAFRYMLPNEDFLVFKQSLSSNINHYLRTTSYFTEADFLHLIGLPENWKTITKYKVDR